jgi:hypothetical protein
MKWLDRQSKFENPEPMNNVLSNKLNYLLMCHVLERNRFDPLSKLICSHQNEAM